MSVRLLLLLVWLLLVWPSQASAQTAPFCGPAQMPAFSTGLAILASQIGRVMGQPTECEHTDPVSGDTLQATTTGLAYYRNAPQQTPIFTDGQDHVALTASWLTGWDGPSIDGPLWLTGAGRMLLGGTPATPPARPPALESPPPPDTYVQVSVDPINGQPPPSFGTISGRVCNESTVWTAADVRLEFAFLDAASLQTPDRATAMLLAGLRACSPQS